MPGNDCLGSGEFINCQCATCKHLGYTAHGHRAKEPGSSLNPWQINHEQPKITISFGGFYQVPDWTC
jgi:hypothetical protein